MQPEHSWSLWVSLFGRKYKFRCMTPLCQLNCHLLTGYNSLSQCGVWGPSGNGLLFHEGWVGNSTCEPVLSTALTPHVCGVQLPTTPRSGCSSLQNCWVFLLIRNSKGVIIGLRNEAGLRRGNRTYRWYLTVKLAVTHLLHLVQN